MLGRQSRTDFARARPALAASDEPGAERPAAAAGGDGGGDGGRGAAPSGGACGAGPREAGRGGGPAAPRRGGEALRRPADADGGGEDGERGGEEPRSGEPPRRGLLPPPPASAAWWVPEPEPPPRDAAPPRAAAAAAAAWWVPEPEEPPRDAAPPRGWAAGCAPRRSRTARSRRPSESRSSCVSCEMPRKLRAGARPRGRSCAAPGGEEEAWGCDAAAGCAERGLAGSRWSMRTRSAVAWSSFVRLEMLALKLLVRLAFRMGVTVFASLEVGELSVRWRAVPPTEADFLRTAELSFKDFWLEKGSDALTLDLEVRGDDFPITCVII
jgi:hypothetical protein